MEQEATHEDPENDGEELEARRHEVDQGVESDWGKKDSLHKENNGLRSQHRRLSKQRRIV